MLHPAEQWLHTLSAERRSNGRATNRYGTLVRAPTGQIWMVFPEKGDRKSSPGAIATCSAAPRSNSSMNRSPLIWSQNRVHRAHSTQRSRSSATSGDRYNGFS